MGTAFQHTAYTVNRFFTRSPVVFTFFSLLHLRQSYSVDNEVMETYFEILQHLLELVFQVFCRRDLHEYLAWASNAHMSLPTYTGCTSLPSDDVGGNSPAIRLPGRLLLLSASVPTVLWLKVLDMPLETTVAPDDPVVMDRFSIMLGGKYCFLTGGAASPFSDPASLPIPSPPPPPDVLEASFTCTDSTIVFRTPFFAISFLRSARAASET